MASISKINAGGTTYDIIPGGLAFDKYTTIGSVTSAAISSNCPNIVLITSTGYGSYITAVGSVRTPGGTYATSEQISASQGDVIAVPVNNTFSINSTTGISYTGNIEFKSATALTMNKNLCQFNLGFKNTTYRNIGLVIIASGDNTCLLGDTLITMADGSQKRIDEIVPGDEVLSIDAYTGEFFANKVVENDADIGGYVGPNYDVFTFDDGTIIKTTMSHLFYNVELGRSVDINKWEIGQRGYTQRKTYARLISHEKVNEPAVGYNIKCGEGGMHTNYFANGILAGDNKMNISKLL